MGSVDLMQRQLIYIVLAITCTSLKVQGKPSDTTESTQSPRLMISIFADPFFLTYPYAAPDVGIECRVTNRFAINSTYGFFGSTGWFKHHISARGIHTNTHLRYYSKKHSPYSFSLTYGYQELIRPFYGTFPSAKGIYLKEATLHQYKHIYTGNAGMRSASGNFFELETFIGFGLAVQNNHFTGLTTAENTHIRFDRIPEIKREGGAGTTMSTAVNFNIRLVYILIK